MQLAFKVRVFSYSWIFIGFCLDFSLFKGNFCGSRFSLAFPMEGPDVVDNLARFANFGSCCSLLSALGVQRTMVVWLTSLQHDAGEKVGKE